MKIKICGLNQKENIIQILSLKPDMAGFIFYPLSPRYFQLDNLDGIDFSSTKKAGVFVNENPEKVTETGRKFRLDYLQLHGSENPEYCRKLKAGGFKLIKAFSVDQDFKFESTLPFAEYCDYFLFDTKGSAYGGTGKKFNWNFLRNYHEQIPFVLSGGVSSEDSGSISELKQKCNFLGCVDINSLFELSPGIKDVSLCRNFIEQLNKKPQLI